MEITNPDVCSAQARTSLLDAVRQQIRVFEGSVDTMVEETIGGKDNYMSKTQALSRSVSAKLKATLERVMQNTVQGEGALERAAYVAKAFDNFVARFKSNMKAFERLYGKQHVPTSVINQLKHLMSSDEGGDFGDRDQTIETRMVEILGKDPNEYAVPSYAGNMQKGHHYEEYMKRVLVVHTFQENRDQIVAAMDRHSSGQLSAAQALMAIAEFTSKSWVPTVWMTYNAVEEGDWHYTSWAYM